MSVTNHGTTRKKYKTTKTVANRQRGSKKMKIRMKGDVAPLPP